MKKVERRIETERLRERKRNREREKERENVEWILIRKKRGNDVQELR